MADAENQEVVEKVEETVETKQEPTQEKTVDYESELKRLKDEIKTIAIKRDSFKTEANTVKSELEKQKAELEDLKKQLEEKESLVSQTIEERRNELLEQLPEGDLREFAKTSFDDNKKLAEFIKLQKKTVTVDSGTNVSKVNSVKENPIRDTRQWAAEFLRKYEKVN